MAARGDASSSSASPSSSPPQRRPSIRARAARRAASLQSAASIHTRASAPLGAACRSSAHTLPVQWLDETQIFPIHHLYIGWMQDVQCPYAAPPSAALALAASMCVVPAARALLLVASSYAPVTGSLPTSRATPTAPPAPQVRSILARRPGPLAPPRCPGSARPRRSRPRRPSSLRLRLPRRYSTSPPLRARASHLAPPHALAWSLPRPAPAWRRSTPAATRVCARCIAQSPGLLLNAQQCVHVRPRRLRSKPRLRLADLRCWLRARRRPAPPPAAPASPCRLPASRTPPSACWPASPRAPGRRLPCSAPARRLPAPAAPRFPAASGSPTAPRAWLDPASSRAGYCAPACSHAGCGRPGRLPPTPWLARR
nr:protein transport protein sec31-like [Aegilops tauschii subsp. strangulata]